MWNSSVILRKPLSVRVTANDISLNQFHLQDPHYFLRDNIKSSITLFVESLMLSDFMSLFSSLK